MRIIVVGAGIVGLCCAWYLRREGHEVTVIDRGGPQGDKCSLGNAGIVVPSHFVPLAAPGMVAAGLKMLAKRDSPFRIKPSLDPELAKWCLLFMKHCSQDNVDRAVPVLKQMHLDSKLLFREFAELWTDGFGFEEHGMVMLCRTEEGLHEESEVAAQARSLGLEAQVLDAEGVRSLELGVQTDVLGGVRYADDCHLAPHTFVDRMQSELAASGVQFEWERTVTGIEVARGKWQGVFCGNERFEGDAAVIAAGSWSGKLAKLAGFEMPLQPGKGLSVTVDVPPARSTSALLLKEARIAVTPLPGAMRFGGTMELGEWSWEADPVRASAMLRNVPAYLPDFQLSALSAAPVWTGHRPCSPDGMPYLGAAPTAPNLLFATGHGMMGVSLGPVTGKMTAEAIGGSKALPPETMAGRFAG